MITQTEPPFLITDYYGWMHSSVCMSVCGCVCVCLTQVNYEHFRVPKVEQSCSILLCNSTHFTLKMKLVPTQIKVMVKRL